MSTASSLTSDPHEENVQPIDEANPFQPKGVGAAEWFLRFVVVALGLVIGAIVAFVIGLSTGWIPFFC